MTPHHDAWAVSTRTCADIWWLVGRGVQLSCQSGGNSEPPPSQAASATPKPSRAAQSNATWDATEGTDLNRKQKPPKSKYYAVLVTCNDDGWQLTADS